MLRNISPGGVAVPTLTIGVGFVFSGNLRNFPRVGKYSSHRGKSWDIYPFIYRYFFLFFSLNPIFLKILLSTC